MSNADPVQLVNGQRLIIMLGIGFVVFTAVMGFGTFGLAKLYSSMFPSHGGAPNHSPRR